MPGSMTSMQSKVSVIVPVFNRSSLVTRCLNSILSSGYPDVEILVIDDGSTDYSSKVIDGFVADYPQIARNLTHPSRQHLGVSASRNLGINAATGRYICFLDSDDVMLPGRFDLSINILDTYPSIDGVYEAAEVVSSDNEVIAFLGPGEEAAFDVLENYEFEPENFIHTGGILVRRGLFERCGLFDTNRWVGEDIHMWLRMFAVGKLVPGQVRRPVVRYYKHPDNTKGYEVSKIELEVLASVYRWARDKNIPRQKLAYFFNKHSSLFYFYLSEARKNRSGIKTECDLLLRAFWQFPQLAISHHYWANLSRSFTGLLLPTA